MAKKLSTTVLCSLVVAGLVAGCTATEPTPATPEPTSESADEFRVVSALGDSVNRGVAACGEPSPCEGASWSTGDASVASVTSRLEELLDQKLVRYNNAVLGADASDLPQQAEVAVTQEPDLVTILIGSNDVCRTSIGAVTPVGTFGNHVSTALDILADAEPQPHVYLSSVPNIVRVLQNEQGRPNALQTWRRSGACRVILDALGGTQPENDLLKSTEQHIRALNSALRDICRTHDNCIFDDEALFEYEFEAADISEIDHFHPSAQGQQRLAELAWPFIAERITE